MKKQKHIKSFNEVIETLNIFDTINNDKSYDDNLSDFIFDMSGKLGGALPTSYFTESDLDIIEMNFKKIYDANIVLNKLLNSKIK